MTLQHVGISVSDVDAAIRFWAEFLRREPRARARLDRPYLSSVVGYKDAAIESAFFVMAPDTELEILQYEHISDSRVDEATSSPGHMHLCLAVTNIQAAYRDALAAGARPVNNVGPVRVDGGPNEGAWAAYLRVPPDSHTFELYQRRSDGTLVVPETLEET